VKVSAEPGAAPPCGWLLGSAAAGEAPTSWPAPTTSAVVAPALRMPRRLSAALTTSAK
jgi:hypothetical protein